MKSKYRVDFCLSCEELVNPNIPDGAWHSIEYRWNRWYNDKNIMYNDIYYTMEANVHNDPNNRYRLFNAYIYENDEYFAGMNRREIEQFRENGWYDIINLSDIDKTNIDEEILGVFNGDRWGTDKSDLTFYFDENGVLIEYGK